ncbi:MAG: lytic transglycosylase domain-containing protein [Rickettsia sp.]|nr:lytic transglycosylase domain-containing protein [Rickettsia sp.]
MTILLCNNSSNNRTIKTLKHIPSQNIKFQKLSLFSRDLIQFITSLKFSIPKSIISWFDILSKEIIKILVIIIVGFSQNMVFAQDLAGLISTVEKEHNIPSGLLKAIAEVESEMKVYAVNLGGKAFIAKSKAEASKNVLSYLRKGHTNIDIGVMQINWYWHKRHFSSLDEMLTPKNNVKYAAKLLTDLYLQHGDWQKAVRLYHSAKPYHHKQYSRKVLLSWLGS